MFECDRHQRTQLTQCRWLAALLPLLATVALLTTGCLADLLSARRHDQQVELLDEVVDGYWHALRWNYLDKAAEFVLPGPDREMWWAYVLDRVENASLHDVNIYRVWISEDMQTGSASITYHLMFKNEGILHTRRAKQSWFYRNGHWYLTIDAKELRRLD